MKYNISGKRNIFHPQKLKIWGQTQARSALSTRNPGKAASIPPFCGKQAAASSAAFNIEIFSPLRDYVGVQSLLKTPLYIRPAEYAQIYGEIYEQFEMIWEEYFGNVEFYEFSAYSHLLQIFTLLARYQINLNHAFSAASAPKRRDYYERLSRSLEYIGKHYAEPISLEEAASLSGFSKFHFSRLFKEYMACTFYEYLVDLRVKAAEAMLAAGELPITEIALQAGFSSISTFNRTFRQKNGCTPGAYRALFSGRQQRSEFEDAQ